MIDGLLALHQATNQQPWLDKAVKLQKTQDELFWDEKNGGYFYTSADHESLLARSKRTNDGAVPSGGSVAAGNLLYFGRVLGEQNYLDRAKRTVLSASAQLDEYAGAAPRILTYVRPLSKTDQPKN